MIDFIRESYPDITDLEIEWCLCAKWLGLNITQLKKDLKSEGSKCSWLPVKIILLFIVLDYIETNIKTKNLNISLSYTYNGNLQDVYIYYKDESFLFESLSQLKELVIKD